MIMATGESIFGIRSICTLLSVKNAVIAMSAKMQTTRTGCWSTFFEKLILLPSDVMYGCTVFKHLHAAYDNLITVGNTGGDFCFGINGNACCNFFACHG